MSTPRAYGGMSDSRRPIHTQGALRNLKLLAYGSLSANLARFSRSFIPARALFEGSKGLEAMRDVILIGGLVLFLCCSAASVPMFLFMLLFCRF
jgi:hypothetical protein